MVKDMITDIGAILQFPKNDSTTHTFLLHNTKPRIMHVDWIKIWKESGISKIPA